MTMDEAIETLEAHQAEHYRTEATDIHFALRLGIEAMKEIRRNRPIFLTNVHLLPGETRE